MADDDLHNRTVLFADGAHGSALQVHEVLIEKAGDRLTTGMVYVWRRDARSDPGTTTFIYNDVAYPNAESMVQAWRDNGAPTGNVIDPQNYLSPSKFPKAP